MRLWGEKDNQTAVYIHRNSLQDQFRGRYISPQARQKTGKVIGLDGFIK
jgi:hypothetical protein